MHTDAVLHWDNGFHRAISQHAGSTTRHGNKQHSNKASSMCFMAAVFPDRSHGSSRLVRVYRWLGEVAIDEESTG
jgi:hypothetical protein